MYKIEFLLLLSYLLYVYTSENLNPFVIPDSYYLKRRWKLGSGVTLAFLISGFLALWLIQSDILIQIAFTVVTTAFLSIPSMILFNRSAQRNNLYMKQD